jgi:hypothetical protein
MNLASVSTISYADSNDGIFVLVGSLVHETKDSRSWESEIKLIFPQKGNSENVQGIFLGS